MSARDAWAACGMPRGKAGIQNIRKRAREHRVLQLMALCISAVPASAASPAVVHVEVEGASASAEATASAKKRNQPAFRLRSDQVQKAAKLKLATQEHFNKVYAAATTEWSELICSGRSGKGQYSADAVAARFNEQLPPECARRLSGKILRKRVKEGKAGLPPDAPGPKSAIPSAFVQSIADYAQMQQLAGNEQKPRQLAAAMVASSSGTIFEAAVRTPSQKGALLRRVRLEIGLATVTSQVIDDRRWKWLTSTNLTEWFAGYVKVLYEWGFIDAIPDDKFEVIKIDARRAARMLNGDESHQKLSNEGETSGPRSKVYISERLGRPGKRKVAYQKHATILVWLSYNGEVGAPHLILATDAQAAKKTAGPDADTSTIRIRPEWSFGIPRVKGIFGLPPGSPPQVFEPSFLLNEKGGMASGGLEDFVTCQIVPAYPTMSRTWSYNDAGEVTAGPTFMQLDAGPDRYTECSLGWRAKMWEAGLCLFPGLPNGTAANQLCDDLFGTYKADNNDRIDEILGERLVAMKTDPSVKLKLDFCDLGRIINGVHGDPVEKRPFARAFTPEKIVAGAAKLGLNLIDLRAALSHKRVRDDSSDGARASQVNAVRESHAQSLRTVAALGFNSDALTVVEYDALAMLEPTNIAPPHDLEVQWNAIKAAGGCAGAHWAAVGARAFNAPEMVGPALERVKERIAEQQGRVEKKASSFNELRTRARELFTLMDDEGYDYDDLSAADLKTMVGYVFRAENKSGVGKVSGTKAACIEYLESLHDGHVEELVQRPPHLVPTTEVEPLLALPAPADTNDAVPLVVATLVDESGFDSLLDLVPGGFQIAPSPPEWLALELQQMPTSDSQLVGKYILYKWPLRVGSWMLGKVDINKNRKQRVGDIVCNYKAFYEADKEWAHRCLSLATYAKKSSSKVDSWVVLEPL